jgi:hypothetical protein
MISFKGYLRPQPSLIHWNSALNFGVDKDMQILMFLYCRRNSTIFYGEAREHREIEPKTLF